MGVCRPSRSSRRPCAVHPIGTMTYLRRPHTVEPATCKPRSEHDARSLRRHRHRDRRGRGHPCPHPRRRPASGSCCLERGNFLPRETQNWDPEPVFVDGRYISPDTWYDADGKPFQPQVHYFVGGATKLYGAALYRLRPQDFGEIKHADGDLAGLAGQLRRLRAVVHEGRVAVPGARQPRRGSDRGPLVEAVPVARGLPRTAHPGDRRRPGGRRLPPVLGAVRHPARRSGPAAEHVHPLHVVRRLSVHGPRQVRRRDDRRAAAADGAERHAARRGRGGEARDRRQRPDRHRRRRVAVRGARRSTKPTSSSCRPARRTAPSCCCNSANDQPSQRPRQRLRPGRAQLHVPQLQGRGRAGEGAQRHRVPEDARASTTSTSVAPTTAGRSGTSRWSASPTAGR